MAAYSGPGFTTPVFPDHPVVGFARNLVAFEEQVAARIDELGLTQAARDDLAFAIAEALDLGIREIPLRIAAQLPTVGELADAGLIGRQLDAKLRGFQTRLDALQDSLGASPPAIRRIIKGAIRWGRPLLKSLKVALAKTIRRDPRLGALLEIIDEVMDLIDNVVTDADEASSDERVPHEPSQGPRIGTAVIDTSIYTPDSPPAEEEAEGK